MAANPYVTVPAGTASQQSLYLQALYRNAALQAEYDQRPRFSDLFAKGLTAGITGGLQTYMQGVESVDKANAQYTNTMIGQMGENERQQALFAAQRQKAELEAQAAARKTEMTGLANQGLWGGLRLQQRPDLEVNYATAPDPEAFTEFGARRMPQTPTQPQVGDVINAMPPSLVGLLGHEDFAAATKQTESRATNIKTAYDTIRSLISEGRIEEAAAVAQRFEVPLFNTNMTPQDQAARAKGQLETRMAGGEDPSTWGVGPQTVAGYKPKEPKEPNLTEGFVNYLVGPGGFLSVADYMSQPPDVRAKVFNEYSAYARQQQAGVAADVEKSKLEVAQPAPQGMGTAFNNLERTEAALANVATLARRVDLKRIGGGLAPIFNEIATTGRYNGIPIPEALRPALSNEEVRLVQAMENFADYILRQRSGGQTAETELKRMFAFLASGRMTGQGIQESIGLLQNSLDSERRIMESTFRQNRWLVPSDTTYTKARKFLRSKNLPYDDPAVDIFLRDNPGYR